MIKNPNESAEILFSDKGFLSELSQIRAKSVLTEVVKELPDIRWTYSSPRFSRNIAGLLYECLTHIDSLSPQTISQARTLAQAWESLSKLGEGTQRDAGLLNAAAAYEIAGYQANASCLARMVAPRPVEEEPKSFVELSSRFFQRLFLLLLQQEKPLLVEPKENEERRVLYQAALAIGAMGLSAASRYFLSGRGSFMKEALELLDEAQQGFASSSAIFDANLAGTIRQLLPLMQKRDIWTNLKKEQADDRVWRRYRMLLARGFGRDLLRSPSVSELWPSQLKAIEDGLLTDDTKILRMPTSAGKTRIAEIAIVNSFAKHANSRCIYVAPYKALVTELELQFQSLFPDLGLKVSTLSGTYETDPFQRNVIAEADILIVTPEKLDLIHRLQPDFLESVKLIIVDEGHMIQDGERGIKLELLIARLKQSLPTARWLFISAVVPDQTLAELSKWLGTGEAKDLLTSEWRAPIQRYATFSWSGTNGRLTYSASESENDLKKAFVPGIISQRTYEFLNPVTGRRLRRRFPEVDNKSQSAAELAFKLSEAGPVLVFCVQPNFVESVAEALLTKLSHLDSVAEPIPIRFSTAETRSAGIAADWLGKDHLLTRCLKRGVAFHHGKLPTTVRTAVESDFHAGKYKIIIATSTLAQGVNLPLKSVIFHSVWRYDETQNRQVRIPERDYWNVAGRAGRARFETEGLVVHICLSENDFRDANYFLATRRDIAPVQSALTQLLKDLIANRISGDVASELLNADTLALLVEESWDDGPTKVVESAIKNSLVSVQAAGSNLDLAPLTQVFSETAQLIIKQIPKEALAAYADTGLRSSSCVLLAEAVKADPGFWEKALTSLDEVEVVPHMLRCMDVCMLIPEMQPKYEYPESKSELLEAWIAGTSMDTIRQEQSPQSESELIPNFIEDLFGNKLPWGISALNRIAMLELGFEAENLNLISQYAPAIVKYGVPHVLPAWAMSAGIPLRSIAINVASEFNKTEVAGSQQDFLNWLSAITRRDWTEKFGLTPSLADDISRSLLLLHTNPYLFTDAIIDLDLSLVSTDEGQRNRASLFTGTRKVSLERDYDDIVDRNAISVKVDGEVIGSLPKLVAQAIAPEMDATNEFEAEATRGTDNRISIKLTRVQAS